MPSSGSQQTIPFPILLISGIPNEPRNQFFFKAFLRVKFLPGYAITAAKTFGWLSGSQMEKKWTETGMMLRERIILSRRGDHLKLLKTLLETGLNNKTPQIYEPK